MIKQAPALTRHDLEAKIVKRCWEDDAFREEFSTDPAGTFGKYLNVPATGLPKVIVHEEEPGTWHIVTPSKPINTSGLSEEDLEKVIGGTTITYTIPIAMSVTVAGVLSTIGAVISVESQGW
jgi:hypothetical protein